MDCQKFDQHAIDALYDELDELTTAALKRHVEGCSRCAGVFSGLRATRDVGILPMEEPSSDLEERIFAAVAVAQDRMTWRRKALRALTWAGSHAMRPQLAMAALFFLVIGSSLLLLRAKPGSMGVLPVKVTERGVPAPEQPEATVLAEPPAEATASPALMPAPSALADLERATDTRRAEGAKDKAAASDAGRAALADARATRDAQGCAAAVDKYDQVGQRFPATSAAADAMWEEASCYKALNQGGRARQLFLALRSNDGYRDRADQELGADATNQQQVAAGPMPRAARAAPPPPAAAPPPPPASPPPAAVAAAPAALADEGVAKAPAATAAPSAPARSGSAGKVNAAPSKKAASDNVSF